MYKDVSTEKMIWILYIAISSLTLASLKGWGKVFHHPIYTKTNNWCVGKGYVGLWATKGRPGGVCLSFSSMKRLGVFLLPPVQNQLYCIVKSGKMLVHHREISSIVFPDSLPAPVQTPWQGRGRGGGAVKKSVFPRTQHPSMLAKQTWFGSTV